MRKNKKDAVDKLKESYNLLVEIMENPKASGYIVLLKKIKGRSREPINLKLFDFKREIDKDIIKLSKKILKKIGMDNLPRCIK